jgi:hypothetical protein
MEKVWNRFKEHFTINFIGILLLGLGVNIVFAFLPNLISNHQQIIMWFDVGIAVIAVGALLIVIGFVSQGEPNLDIVFDEGESESQITDEGDKYKFEIYYTLKTRKPPINIAKIMLYIQGSNDILVSPEPEFKVDNTRYSHKSVFESPKDIAHQKALKPSNKYQLVIGAGEHWKSKGFTISKIIVPGTNKLGLVGYPMDVTISKTDKGETQT